MSTSNLGDKRVSGDADVEAAGSKRPKLSSNDISPVDNSLKERDVGITHFISSDLPGFSGQIKQRYTDFLVNEIGLDDKVVHLTDKGFNMPKKPKKSAEEKAKEQEIETAQRNEFKVDAELRKELVELLGEEDVVKIEEVYVNAQKMETTKSFDDKSERTKIHVLLRNGFNNELESVTTETNTFRVARNNKKSRVNKHVFEEQNKDANGVENWGYGPTKEFVHFTLHKENKDTMQAVSVICKLLRMPPKVIRYAGTKDRRGVTVQRLSISKIKIDRLNALNRTLKGMIIGGFKFEDQSLNLGDLKGNEFTICVRDVKLKNPNSDVSLEQILEKGCNSLTENGFVNYFGMQRFGTFSISTHEIGKELLLDNWKKAATLILSDQENVLPKSKEARRYWAETKDPVGTLKLMPRDSMAETAILHSLAQQKKDESEEDFSENAYYIAVMKIPRNLRTMYVHAYQSYIWNAVASKRLELFGLEVVEGDLVIDESDKSKPILDEDELEFNEDINTSTFVRAKPLSQEDIKSGKYTITDVVLPTPGFDIIYPTKSELMQIYVDLMQKDGMDPMNMKRKVRDFSMAGSYRNVIQKPKNLTFKTVKYNESTQQLLNTDLEILNNRRGKENCQKYMKDKLERIVPDKSGENTAVILTFGLGTSAYATMLLRELMKVETSRRGDMCNVTTA